MKRVTVSASGKYDVVIGAGLENAVSLISGCAAFEKAMVVTDKTVDSLYGGAIRSQLLSCGRAAFTFAVEPGDKSKSTENLAALWETLAENEFSKGDIIISLGGGVPGDLAGFAAATFLRGIRAVHIPTSLLAMVDSSVGGKTAVNLSRGKNLAGAFHQPALVLIFPELLKTLPVNDYNDGMAEVIKYSMLEGEKLIPLLESAAPPIEEIITLCVDIKRRFVERDELDRGERRLLNLGHTAGHAAEAESGFTLSHGSAVAAGMAVITRAAVKSGECDGAVLEFLLSQLERYSLPCGFSLPAEAVIRRITDDKKRSGENITFALPVSLGAARLKTVKTTELAEFIKSGWANG